MSKVIKLTVFFLIVAAIAVGAYYVIVKTGKTDEPKKTEETEPTREELDKSSVFGDIIFEQCVREITGEAGDIDLTELSETTELDLTFSGKSIENEKKINRLDGLKYFPNLKKLVIDKNLIYDISAVADCKKLEYFSAEYCMFSDCTALSELTLLTHLDVKGNGINDCKFLEKLKDLEYLDLSQNRIEDLSVLAGGFEALTHLDISSNATEALEAVYTLKTLEYLNISAMGLHSLNGIVALDNLTHLDASDNMQIKDLTPVAGCDSLRELYADANTLEDFDELEACDTLEVLSLNGNRLTDISVIMKMKSLKRLYVRNNRIAEFEPLFKTELEKYDVEGNFFEQWLNNNPEYEVFILDTN